MLVIEILGKTLGVAVGMMISPLPIIGLIMVLMGKHPGRKGIAYTLGWVIGTLVLIYVAIKIGSSQAAEQPTKANGITQLVVGGLFLFLSFKQLQVAFRSRKHPTLPPWMEKIATMNVPTVFGLSVLLTFANLKNIPLAAQAVTAVVPLGPIPASTQWIAAILFALITALPAWIPTIWTVFGGEKARHFLERAKDFMTHYNHLIMGGLFLVMGSQALGAGIQIVAAKST